MDLAALKEHVDQLETAQECSIGALTHMQVRQSLAARKLPPNTSIMLRLAPNQIPGSSATSLPAAGTLTRLSLSEPAASYCMCSREFTFDAVFPGHLTPAAVALELLGQRDIDPFTDTSDPSTTRLYLLGPSGSGKTTLLREICTRALLSPKALIETAIEIDPMGNTKARQDLKTKALQSHNEIAQLTEILNCRKSAETPENRSSSRTALAITISVDSDEGSSKLVIVDLPGWEVAETRVNQGTGVSSGIINQEHGVIEEVLYKWAQGIKWVGRPSGKIACWLKEELQTVDEDDKVVFIMFARGGEKRRWRGLVNFLGKMKTE
ncbi:hypothetical protein BGX38DRAFT_1205222 [Terfezia claveryi]|nr:hypothetical protein BGX38DRAFT_1205222 [Terfezia claveryi]